MGNSLERQQAALYRLKGCLEGFKNELQDQLRRYRAVVDSLKEQGLAQEVYSTYLNSYYEKDRYYIELLIRHMEEADTKYVNDNLQEAGVNKDVAQRSLGDF